MATTPSGHTIVSRGDPPCVYGGAHRDSEGETMSGTGTFYLLSQIGYSVLPLIVYGVAFVLALVYRRRAPRASTLTLAGVGVLVFSTIAGMASTVYLVHAMAGGQGPAWSFEILGIISFAGNCVRAVGLLLLVLAIFAGRGPSVRQQTERETSRQEDEPRRSQGEDGGLFREGRGP